VTTEIQYMLQNRDRETVSECLNKESVSMSEQRQCQHIWTETVSACLNRDSVSMSEQRQCRHVWTETEC